MALLKHYIKQQQLRNKQTKTKFKQKKKSKKSMIPHTQTQRIQNENALISPDFDPTELLKRVNRPEHSWLSNANTRKTSIHATK